LVTILCFNAFQGNGTLELELRYTFDGLADSSTFDVCNFDSFLAMLVRIQNNPGDSYFWDGNNGKFSWTWKTGTTGVVLGPMAHIISGRRFSLQFNV
jgi:hypothetical protein